MNRPALAAAVLMVASATGHTAADVPYDEELSEVVVTVPEPIYVAPTTRDRIGRVWVPVQVDGKGPFRLVLDTGAQRSAVTPRMALQLGLPQDRSPPVMLHGTTGMAITPTIAVASMQVGDLYLQPADMPVVADVFGGAEGLLGTDGMQDRRIFIDFRADFISITRSENRRAERGFTSVHFLPDRLNLPIVSVLIGNVPVRAIIDTGSQSTVGNLALQTALGRREKRTMTLGTDEVQGATGAWQIGVGINLSPIRLGDLTVNNAHVTFTDLHIFDRWGMAHTPALLVGMDIIGLLDQLVIDYHRRELQIKARTRS